MEGINGLSLVLGAALGFLVSVSGLWLRRNWERHDREQEHCRDELVGLLHSLEAARLAVRRERIRLRAWPVTTSPSTDINLLIDRFGEAAEVVYEFSSRTRRLRSGSLRLACASFVFLLRSFHHNLDNPPSEDELDGSAMVVRRLIEGTLYQLEHEQNSVDLLSGRPCHCPPPPYSAPLPGTQS